jgi:hypothetical protein
LQVGFDDTKKSLVALRHSYVVAKEAGSSPSSPLKRLN